MYKLKENINFEELKKFGYIIDKVSIVPHYMIKVIDNSSLIKIGIDNPSYNIWSGKCWNESREIRYYAVYDLDIEHKWTDEETAPYYIGNWSSCNEDLVEPNIKDLIEADLVEKV